MTYRINTPANADLTNTYSQTQSISGLGLGDCDLPISIQKVKVTPIPGKYDFRALTFKTALDFSTPLEQD
jgi:hypothetical protein